MGDVADMMLDGTLCQSCGELLIDEHTEPNGFPSLCPGCAEDHPLGDVIKEVDARQVELRMAAHFGVLTRETPTQCPFCKRWVKAIGFSDHFRDKHLEAP